MVKEENYEDMLATAVHEVFHGLGFSSWLFDDFRDESGNVRNKDSWLKTSTENGAAIQKVSLAAPLGYARETFGCDSLDGVAIENIGGSGTAGSHWKKLFYFDDFMNGVGMGESAIYTKLTFSMLEASGWYQINYEPLGLQLWGRGKGCTFATGNKKCISNGVSQMEGHVCSETNSNIMSCSWDKAGWGPCSVSTYSSSLSSNYQYFSSKFESVHTFYGYKFAECSYSCSMTSSETDFNLI